MGVMPMEMVKFATYQLKDVFQVLFNKCKEGSAVDMGPRDWKKFEVSFLDRFFDNFKLYLPNES